MGGLTASAIELYNGWFFDRGNDNRQRPTTLFCVPSGYPDKFRPELAQRLEEIRQSFKAGGFNRWCNAPDYAAKLVSGWAGHRPVLPRIAPCHELPPSSHYLYRVFLNTDESIDITCFGVKHDEHGLLISMMPLDKVNSEY